jgi:hypothetical protein
MRKEVREEILRCGLSVIPLDFYIQPEWYGDRDLRNIRDTVVSFLESLKHCFEFSENTTLLPYISTLLELLSDFSQFEKYTRLLEGLFLPLQIEFKKMHSRALREECRSARSVKKTSRHLPESRPLLRSETIPKV